ncbi:MAG: ABC transporter permease [Clostridia bacterium]|nr:ABC transporter permease [Clostridia bacterium]
MKRTVYFFLQLKRFARAIPSVIAISLVLLLCIFAAFSAFVKNEEENEAKIEIGIVGNADDTYLALGMAALRNFDSSRLALNLSFMGETEAKEALERGDLAAYIVIPEDFVMNAYYGDVGKLTYVSSRRAVSMADFVKDEILDLISVLLVESQRGVYAAGNVAEDLAHGMKYGTVANDAAIEYVDFILSRSKMYRLESFGVTKGIGLVPSVFCGVIVFFLLLLGIGFAGVFARKNSALPALLSSRRIGAFSQICGEYFAFSLLGIFSLSLLFGGIVIFFGGDIEGLIGHELDSDFFFSVMLSFIMISALQTFIFEVTEGIMAGALSQFFVALSLSYFSGCLYPVYFFPEVIQHISPYLPAGCARELLASALSGGEILRPIIIIIAYLFVFLLASILLRRHRIIGRGGDAI